MRRKRSWLLGEQESLETRSLARDAYLTHPNSFDDALADAERRIRERFEKRKGFIAGFFQALIIAAMIELAKWLLQYWFSNDIAIPVGGAFQSGEPGA